MLGNILRKATGFIVPTGSVLETMMAQRCTRDHDHDWAFGGKKYTEPAGAWPQGMVRDMIRAATLDAAQKSTTLRDVAWHTHYLQHNDEEMLATTFQNSVCHELYLRSEHSQVYRGRPKFPTAMLR